MLFFFNPITGGKINGGIVKLGYKPLTSMLLTGPGSPSPLIIMDSEQRIHVYPQSARDLVIQYKSAIYLYVLHPGHSLKGYRILNNVRCLQTHTVFREKLKIYPRLFGGFWEHLR